jgi:hypothetical protein
VRTGCFSKDSRIKSRSAAHPCGGPAHRALGFHSRRPSKPPSRNVEHDRGEPPGSTALAARRARYPRPEQMARKMLRNVEIRGVHAARNGPSEDRKSWQHIELGIHGLRSWGRNWSRKVRETRSSSDVQGHEGGRRPPTFGRPGSVVGPQRPLRRWSPAPRALPSGNGFVFRLDSALVRPKSQYNND